MLIAGYIIPTHIHPGLNVQANTFGGKTYSNYTCTAVHYFHLGSVQ